VTCREYLFKPSLHSQSLKVEYGTAKCYELRVVREWHFGPAVGVRSECIVTQLIPWEAQYTLQGTTFMENAFINEYALLMAGIILRTVAWIFMHEL